jgi:hypothetical protein
MRSLNFNKGKYLKIGQSYFPIWGKIGDKWIVRFNSSFYGWICVKPEDVVRYLPKKGLKVERSQLSEIIWFKDNDGFIWYDRSDIVREMDFAYPIIKDGARIKQDDNLKVYLK